MLTTDLGRRIAGEPLPGELAQWTRWEIFDGVFTPGRNPVEELMQRADVPVNSRNLSAVTNFRKNDTERLESLGVRLAEMAESTSHGRACVEPCRDIVAFERVQPKLRPTLVPFRRKR